MTTAHPPADATRPPSGSAGEPTGRAPSPRAHRGTRGASGWAVRWGAALRIARRDAMKHKGRSAVVIAMVGLPVVAAVFAVSTLLSANGTPLTRVVYEIGPRTQAELVAYDHVIMQDTDGRSTVWFDELAERPTLGAIASVLGTAESDLAVQYLGQAEIAKGDRRLGPLGLVALEHEALADVYTPREGRLPDAPDEVALSYETAQRLVVALGDEVTVGDQIVTVVGVLDGRNLPSAGAVSVPGVLDVQETSRWYVLDTPVTWADVVALNEMGIKARSRYVAEHPPAPSAMPISQHGGVYTESNAAALGLGAGIGVIALVEAVLLVGPAFAVGAKRQTRQLALVAASGGTPRDVRRIVLASGLVTGAVAGVAGVLLALAVFAIFWWVLSTTDYGLPAFIVPGWIMIGAVGFAVGLGALAALAPARTASRLDVVAALAGRRADAAPSRGVPWAGVVLGVIGLVLAVLGGMVRQVALLVVGIVALEIGVVLATGGLLALVARLAPRLSLAPRFALRDALRQRSRSVPAVAAVVAAVAGAVAGGLAFSTQGNIERNAWFPVAGVGSILVNPDWGTVAESGLPGRVPSALEAGEHVEEVAEQALARVESVVPVAGSAVVHLLGSPFLSDEDWLSSAPMIRPDRLCPVDPNASDVELQAKAQDDPRCTWRQHEALFHGDGLADAMVDDGTAMSQLGHGTEGAAAAAALAEGQIVVGSPDEIWEDGTAHIEVTISTPDPESTRTIELVAPAFLQTFNPRESFLPMSLVAQHPDLSAVPAGFVIQTPEPYSTEWADRVNGSLRGGWVWVQGPNPFRQSATIYVLLAIVAAVALGATWLSVGLAAAETRPDLATLAAVGAGPGVRRRVAAAQAGVVAVLGVGVGVVLGLALGLVLARWMLETSDFTAWVNGAVAPPGIAVPWWYVLAIGVGLPVLGVAGAWLTAPRRLALTRRVDQ